MAKRERARSTRVEHQERLDQVEAWLAQRLPRSEVLRLARKRWRISERQADRYIAEATTQWSTHVQPERDVDRRRNLSTADVAIAESFRAGKFRDVAPLLRLRASLDGSLSATSDTPTVPPTAPAYAETPTEIIEMLSETIPALLEASLPITPELSQAVAKLVDALASFLAAPNDRSAVLEDPR